MARKLGLTLDTLHDCLIRFRLRNRADAALSLVSCTIQMGFSGLSMAGNRCTIACGFAHLRIYCRNRYDTKSADWSSFWLAAIWPNMVIFSNLILADTLFLFFATVGLFASLKCVSEPRYIYAFVAGGFGLMILVRPIGLFVPLAAAAFIAGRMIWQSGNFRRAIACAMVLTSLVAMILLPIVWRNVTQFGTWQLTSQSGIHLLMWVVSYAKSIDAGTPFGDGTTQMNAKLAKELLRLVAANRNLMISTTRTLLRHWLRKN